MAVLEYVGGSLLFLAALKSNLHSTTQSRSDLAFLLKSLSFFSFRMKKASYFQKDFRVFLFVEIVFPVSVLLRYFCLFCQLWMQRSLSDSAHLRALS